MRAFLLTTMLALAALNAAAQTSAAAAGDPLLKQIMSKQLTQDNGGVTGVVRIGSGQAIALSIVDPLTPVAPAEPLKDAVADEKKALDGLAPAAGLAPKPAAKTRARAKARRADEQLRKLSREERKADWNGRK